MRIEVVYVGLDGKIRQYEIELPPEGTCGTALAASGVLRECPEIRFDAGYALAVFGRRIEVTSSLEDSDRLEILRPLRRNPQDARRVRARQGSRVRR